MKLKSGRLHVTSQYPEAITENTSLPLTNNIITAFYVTLTIPGYSTLYFSDHPSLKTQYAPYISYPGTAVVTPSSDPAYVNLGRLLSITDSRSDLRATTGNMSVTLSGVPDSSLTEILGLKIKGSSIVIDRLIYVPNPPTGYNSIGGYAGRFNGIVSNYNLDEDWPEGSREATNKIVLTCSSTVDLLLNKVSGRRTNPTDIADPSMDRVLKLSNSNFNFGAVIR